MMSLQKKIIDEVRKEKLIQWVNDSPDEFIEMVDDIYEKLEEYNINKCKKYIRDKFGEGNILKYRDARYSILNGPEVSLRDEYIYIFYHMKLCSFKFVFLSYFKNIHLYYVVYISYDNDTTLLDHDDITFEAGEKLNDDE